jgi:FkbM family methyltransferase
MIPVCRVRFDDGDGLSLRPESWDYGIARSILLDNEYRLPERFSADDLILDIGAHVGAFAYACLQRGAGRVMAFEPDPDNARLAAANLAPYADRCELQSTAVWRSDRAADSLCLRRARHCLNTGGHDVLSDRGDGLRIEAIALDAVLSRLQGTVRLLKIDCEGAEYPILLTATRLDRVEAIAGEFHLFGPMSEHGEVTERMRVDGVERYDAETLAAHLHAQGFRVEIVQQGAADHGLFFAQRPRSELPPQTLPRHALRRDGTHHAAKLKVAVVK